MREWFNGKIMFFWGKIAILGMFEATIQCASDFGAFPFSLTTHFNRGLLTLLDAVRKKYLFNCKN
ncbi:hypothetical protein YC2023_089648 [Brassica napus]